MKIAVLKLANAIKCGPKTLDFLTSKTHDMTLSDGIVIRVQTKTKEAVSCYTSLMNTVWWHPLEEPAAKGDKSKKAKDEVVL